MTRVLICGGRGYDDWERLCEEMMQINYDYDISCIIHGACCDKEGILLGADALAEKWAIMHEFPYFGIPAKWTKHGKAAGPIRNNIMNEKGAPHLVVAFPGGRGTKSMIDIARKAGVEVMEIKSLSKKEDQCAQIFKESL